LKIVIDWSEQLESMKINTLVWRYIGNKEWVGIRTSQINTIEIGLKCAIIFML